MAQTIKLKRSAQSGASGIPSTSDLALGEVGINTYHGKMYIKKDDGTESIVEVGDTSGYLPLSGGTLTGNLSLGDNVKLQLGNQTNGDLQIFHDGSNSYISDIGTGNLHLQGSNLTLEAADGTNYIAADDGVSVYIYHPDATNQVKLSTTSSGISVTGSVVADGLTVDTGSTFALSATLGHTGGSQLFFLNDDGGSRNQIDSQKNSASADLDLATGGVKRQKIASNGDISFYNDSAAQGLFWDSSTSRLGLGVTNSASLLHISGANGSGRLELQNTWGTTVTNWRIAPIISGVSNNGFEIRDVTQGVSRFVINSSGNASFSGAVTSTGLTVSTLYPKLQLNSTSGVARNFSVGTNNETFTIRNETASSDSLTISNANKVNIPQSLMVGATTAPSSRFHLKSASRGSVALRVTDSDTTNDILRSGSQPDGDGYLQLRTVGGAGNVLFDASGDSYVNGGNFGIGVVPAYKLHISGATNANDVVIQNSSHGVALRMQANTNSMNIFTTGSKPLYLGTNNTTNQVVLDTSGNLLVGKTALGTNTAGFEARSSGFIGVTRADVGAYFTRLTTDGEIIQFRKDSTTVGSIGAKGGTAYLIGSNKGLRVSGSGLIPITTGGANSDATYDLGDPAVRFKDLYLSGSAFIDTQTRLGNGSASSPAYSFSADSDSGMFRATTNQLGFATGGQEAMRIDASQNLLVGTASAVSTSSSQTGAEMRANGIVVGAVNGNVSFIGNRIGSDGDIALFRRDGTTVGSIGVSGGKLQIDGPANNSGLRFHESSLIPRKNGDVTNGQVDLGYNDGSTILGFRNLTLSNAIKASTLKFENSAGTTEYARFSGGNLLVGKTSSALQNAGVEIRPTNLMSTRINGDALSLNRRSSDGAIASFYKDGTAVGSIGTIYGDLTIGDDDVGIRFDTGTGLVPWDLGANSTGGLATNGTIDLGVSGAAFKDLYLSGTVNATQFDITAGTDAKIYTSNAISEVGSGIFAIQSVNSAGSALKPLGFRAEDIRFATGSAERTRIASNGTLYHGKTADSLNTGGLQTLISGQTSITQSYTEPLRLNRMSTEGAIQKFYYNGGEVGSIGADNASINIGSGNTGLLFYNTATAIYPRTAAGAQSNGAINLGGASDRFKDLYLSGKIYGSTLGIGDAGIQADQYSNAVKPFRPDITSGTSDNYLDLGTSSVRWVDIYATNGTIQTSDRNEKQDIESLTEAEERVAIAAKGLLKKFRWKSAVEDKGDDARIHFGIIAQDLQDAFEAEGLDAGRYGMFTSNTWTNEDGEEQTRMGVRYSELLAFIISAI